MSTSRKELKKEAKELNEFERLKQSLHTGTPNNTLTKEELNDPDRYKAQKVADLVEAAREGKLPTTGQTVAAIDKLETDQVIPEMTSDLSRTGQKVALDVEQALDTSKEVLIDKNRNDLLQKLILYSSRAANELGGADTDMSLSPEQQTLLTDLRNKTKASMERLTSLVQLIGTSSEFRSLLSDLTRILQNTVENQAQKTDETSKVLNIAQRSNEEYSKNSSAERPSYADKLSQHREDASNIALSAAKKEQPIRDAAKQQIDVAADAFDRVVPSDIKEDVKDLVASAAESSQKYSQQYQQGASASDVIAQAGQDLKQKLNVMELPQEKRDQIANRLEVAMQEIHANPEFRKGFSDLFALMREIGETATEATSQLQTNGSGVYSRIEIELSEARKCAKALIENFAGHTSLDPLLSAVFKLQSSVQNDKQVLRYWNDLQNFLTEPVRKVQNRAPGQVSAPDEDQLKEYRDRANELVERGRSLAYDKYGDQMQRISELASQFVDALREDALTQEFATEINTIVKDMTLDSAGRPTIKYELIQDLTKVVPRIANKLAYLPVPRVENEDEEVHYILDNIVVKCTNIVPKYLRILTDTIVDTTRAEGNQARQLVRFTLSKVQASAKDIAFYYNKKRGLIAPADVGLIDFEVRGANGLTVTVELEPNLQAQPGEAVFRTRNVNVDVEDLKIRFHKTHHDTMYKILNPLIKSKVRKTMEDEIEENIRLMLERLNANLAATATSLAQSSERLKGTSGAPITGLVNREAELAGVHRKHAGLPEWSSPAFNVEE